ncbi:MAG TPA: hypothetical protein VE972_05295 [Conexibacter sp.]|nr:hypothetical protein [Conexibacter sp.]
MVSPLDKNGGDVMGDPSKVTAAKDGSAVTFVSVVGFAGAVGSSLAPDYVSVRDGKHGTNGWSTHSIVPPHQEPLPFFYSQGTQATTYRLFSSDLSKGIVRAFTPVTDDPNVALTRNLYLRSDLRTGGGGAYQLVSASAAPVPLGPPGGVRDYAPGVAGASADFSHVIFESKLSLTADAPPCSNVNYSTCSVKLYQWTPGAVRLVGILPGGGAAASSAAGSGVTLGLAYVPHVISNDGSRVFFTSPANFSGAGDLYARLNDTTTVQINASERTPSDAAEPATYLDATPDGSMVFFKSDEQLTNTDGSGLYRYDFNAPVGARLTLLAQDPRGLIGTSDDGSSVYIVSSTNRIGLWRDGVLRDLGGFVDADDSVANTGDAPFSLVLKTGRVSPSGRFLLFSARQGTDLTGYNHGTACGGGPCSQLYVYDAAGNAGAGRLACASCNLSAPAATGDASSEFHFGTGVTSTRPYLNRALSDDGQVFFSTSQRLVKHDTNGKVRDVYEYDIPTGVLKLISSGTSPFDSVFMDASADGSNVFFVTRDRLVGWDRDDAYDLYDARVAGGFPEPPAVPSPCSGDACHRSQQTPSSAASPGSATFQGSGDAIGPASTGALHAFVLSRRQVAAWAKTGAVWLRVRVSEPGRLLVRVRGRVGRRMSVLSSVTRNAGHRGIVVVRLRLPLAVRARLHRTGRLRISLVISYSDGADPQHASVTLVDRGR